MALSQEDRRDSFDSYVVTSVKLLTLYNRKHAFVTQGNPFRLNFSSETTQVGPRLNRGTSDAVDELITVPVTILLTIIGVKRLRKEANHETDIDAITLRAARKLLSIILYFQSQQGHHPSSDEAFVFVQFITFFPFCAIFTLYEHILSCVDPEACEEDLQTLESIGAVMIEAAALCRDFALISKIVNALNKASRAVLEKNKERASHIARTDSTQSILRQRGHQSLHDPDLDNFASLATDTSQSFLDSMQQDLDISSLSFISDFPRVNSDFQPQQFIRAVENDFTGRDWHESWWDMGGSVDTELQSIAQRQAAV